MTKLLALILPKAKAWAVKAAPGLLGKVGLVAWKRIVARWGKKAKAKAEIHLPESIQWILKQEDLRARKAALERTYGVMVDHPGIRTIVDDLDRQIEEARLVAERLEAKTD